MSSAQRAQVEAADRRLLKRVGLNAPENDNWLRGWCEVGDTPESNCVGHRVPRCVAVVSDDRLAEPGWVPAAGLDGCFGDYPVLAVLRRVGQTVVGSGWRAGKASTSGGHTSRSSAVLGRWLTR